MIPETSPPAGPLPHRLSPIVALGMAALLLTGAALLPTILGLGTNRAEGAAPRGGKHVLPRVKPRAPLGHNEQPAKPPKPKPTPKPKPRPTPNPRPTPTPTPTPAPTPNTNPVPAVVSTPWVVLGYNDLGMHCMNQDDSEICILPPYNNLHAQVIVRGESPQIVTEAATVSYSIPGNTYSVGKTNFWTYAKALFGVNLPPNIGLTGNGLTGVMTPTASNDWVATGIPLTPTMDNGTLNPYALSQINVKSGTRLMATTKAVVPVSWEISCNLCHNRPGFTSVAADILEAHDRLHHTDLQHNKPVLCASCHADPALGTAGVQGISSMSSAMHKAHASRMTPVGENNCYACHPGMKTQCQRDIHYAKGIHCGDCHGSMAAVGNPARTPWVDEPKCANCHNVPGHQYEEPGKLFKQSRGHNGVMCASCHGSPHAITPTVTAPDNVQAITIQGHAGTINNCVVCHKGIPDDGFNHSLGGD